MGFKVLGDRRDEFDIWVVDANEQTLTSISRVDELHKRGYKFEAATSQAAIVEGLLLSYLLVAKQVDLIKFDQNTEELLARLRITFGQLKDALKNTGAFHDKSLEADVESYVLERNQVAHHLAGELKNFDLEQFFEKGKQIAFALWRHILAKIEHHKQRNP